MNTESTLKERGSEYGSFEDGSITMQAMKSAVRNNPRWKYLKANQKESIEMILHKVGRIVNGNSNHIDSWHDISGYAKLVENSLTGKGEK